LAQCADRAFAAYCYSVPFKFVGACSRLEGSPFSRAEHWSLWIAQSASKTLSAKSPTSGNLHYQKEPEVSCRPHFSKGGFSMWLDITVALIAIYLLTFTAILIMEAANVI
jgi:hypothetical protein